MKFNLNYDARPVSPEFILCRVFLCRGTFFFGFSMPLMMGIRKSEIKNCLDDVRKNALH